MRARLLWLLVLVPLVIPTVALAALAVLRVTPGTVGFPPSCAWTTSSPSPVVISNDGDTDATDLRVVASPSEVFRLAGPTAIPTLSPGTSATVGVAFVPAKGGDQTGRVRIDYVAQPTPSPTPSASASATPSGGGGGGPKKTPTPVPKSTTVALSGSGIDRFIDASPRALNFGDVRVGRDGPERTVTIFEDGDQDLRISSIALEGGEAGDFTVKPSKPTSVVDGAPLTLRLGFTARGVGARATDLVIRSDSCTEPVLKVALAGIGVEPDIIALPAAVAFDERPVGKRTTRGVSIANQGGWDLRLAGMSIGGADADHFDIRTKVGFPKTLPPGAALDLRVRFTGLEPGARTATLRVESNDPDTKVLRVKLSGVVGEPKPTPTPTIDAPTPTPTVEASTPPGPGLAERLGAYAAELVIGGGVLGFFVSLVLIRRVRGIPE